MRLGHVGMMDSKINLGIPSYTTGSIYNQPMGICFDGTYIWTANVGNPYYGLSKIQASNGSLIVNSRRMMDLFGAALVMGIYG